MSPWLLKFASEGALPLELLKWYGLAQPDATSFGLCEKHVPSRPEEKWVAAGKSHRRVFDKEESKQFYLVSASTLARVRDYSTSDFSLYEGAPTAPFSFSNEREQQVP